MMGRVRLALVALVLLGASLASVRPAAAEQDSKWTYLDTSVSGTYIPLVGYFSYDKYADVLWYGPGDAPDVLWLGSSQIGVFTKKAVNISGNYRPMLGDFAGDSHTDIFWYCPGNCPDQLWRANGSASVFTPRSQTVNGFYSISTVQADGKVAMFSGGYVMRDYGFGKDDILWYNPDGTDGYWHFSDDGSGAHSGASLSISGRYGFVRGNFSGGSPYDDLMLYGPGTQPDYLWTADGTGRFTQRIVTVNGRFAPTAIDRSVLIPPSGYVRPMDSIYWFDAARCGARSPVWHFTSATTWSTRYADVPSEGVCRQDNFVQPFPGSSSVIVYRYAGFDYQAFDTNSSSRVDYLTPGNRDVDGTISPATGDFNGDSKPDILWYGPGALPDSIWYGRVGLATSGMPGKAAPESAFDPQVAYP